jgi:hypothetical protein
MTSHNALLYGRAENPFSESSIVSIDFVPSSHTHAIIAVCNVCLVISWIAVLLRSWNRGVIMRFWGYDDVFMFITIVSTTWSSMA